MYARMVDQSENTLTLICVSFLGVRFEVSAGGVGGKITPCLKLVRIMLET